MRKSIMNRKISKAAAWILAVILAVTSVQPMVFASELSDESQTAEAVQPEGGLEAAGEKGSDSTDQTDTEDVSVQVPLDQTRPEEDAFLSESYETEADEEVILPGDSMGTEVVSSTDEAAETPDAGVEKEGALSVRVDDEGIEKEDAFTDDGFFGDSCDGEKTQTFRDYLINPLYADVIDESDLRMPDIRDSSANVLYGSGTVYSTTAAAVTYVRSKLVSRTADISLGINYTGSPESLVVDVFNTALTTHTGIPQEGDYLWFQYGGAGYSAEYTDQVVYVTFSVKYYTTAAQEAEVNRRIKDVLAGMDLSGKSEYEKTAVIYDFICRNVSYDYANLENDAYDLKYTAYGALQLGTAVCQGYAVLFYRLALEAGLDSRVIPGTAEGGGHAWNIVRIGQYYYNLDSTWDSEINDPKYYYYFLCSDASFAKDHQRDDIASTSAFYKSYPMASKNFVLCDETGHTEYKRIEKATFSTRGKISTICKNCGTELKVSKGIACPKTFTLSKTSYTYNGKVLRPTVTVKNTSGNVINPDYYTVTYSSGCVNAGKYYVTIKFKTYYSGTKVLSYTINRKNQKINASDQGVLLGSGLFSLGAKLTTGNGKLTYASANPEVAAVSPLGNVLAKSIGKATIYIKAAQTKNFNQAVKKVVVSVLPRGTAFTGMVNTTGQKAVLRWTGNSSVYGYQILYWSRSDYSDRKILTLKPYTRTSAVLSGLKKGTWNFRIRTFCIKNSEVFYSPWGAVKKLSITK